MNLILELRDQYKPQGELRPLCLLAADEANGYDIKKALAPMGRGEGQGSRVRGKGPFETTANS
jgi:hypothetical protein